MQVVQNEFEGFCCYGYRTENPSLAQRQCNIYVTCRPLYLDDVRPFTCRKLNVPPGNTKYLASRWGIGLYLMWYSSEFSQPKWNKNCIAESASFQGRVCCLAETNRHTHNEIFSIPINRCIHWPTKSTSGFRRFRPEDVVQYAILTPGHNDPRSTRRSVRLNPLPIDRLWVPRDLG